MSDTHGQLSDWIDNVVAKSKLFELRSHERALSALLIDLAFRNASDTSTSVGLSLAAAFDLFVSVEYYRNITNKGWVYCPQDPPLLIYPFTNTCPRCVLNNRFHFHKANKPESGSIGFTTSRLLCVFLTILFERTGKSLDLYQGTEPIDLIISDKLNKIILLAEVKAAPLTTLPLAVPVSKQTTMISDEIVSLPHASESNPFIDSIDLNIFVPSSIQNTNNYSLFDLGSRNGENPDNATLFLYNDPASLNERFLIVDHGQIRSSCLPLLTCFH